MRLKGYAFLAIALILLSYIACGQAKQSIERPSYDRYDAVKNCVKRAVDITAQLEVIDWGEFSDIGIVCPPQGMCSVSTVPAVEKKSVTFEALTRWTSVAALLPSPRTAKIYRIQCENCLRLADELSQLDPGNDPGTVSQSENATVSQWQELYDQLQSALQGAEYLVSKNKTIAADYTFPEVVTYFAASNEHIKRDYLDRFMTATTKYIQLQDEIMSDIQQAERLSLELANRQPGASGQTEQQNVN